MFKIVSQIGIKYPESVLNKNASFGKFASGSPKPGERLPFIEYHENGTVKNIHQLLSATDLNLLIFGDNDTSELLQQAIRKYKVPISAHIFPANDTTQLLRRKFGINTRGFYLVRPDLYITYRSNGIDIAHFSNYLDSIYLQQ